MSSEYSLLYNNLVGTSTANYPKEKEMSLEQLRKRKSRRKFRGFRGPDRDDLKYYCDEEDECVIPGEKLREKKDREKSSFEKAKKLWNERKELMEETKPRLHIKSDKPYRGPLVIMKKQKGFVEKYFGKYTNMIYDFFVWILMVFGCMKEKHRSEYYIAHEGRYNNFEEDMKRRKGDDNNIRADFLIEKNKDEMRKLVRRMRTNVLKQELKLYEDVQDHQKRDVIKGELKKRGKIEKKV